MRTAVQNPNKLATIAPLSRVVVLVVTHLPSLQDEYHKTRYAVIQRSIMSLVKNIAIPADKYSFIIWDNGSSRTLVDWLLDGYDLFPDSIILSRNIGKTNALKSVMRMLPPGSILAYGDDDIEYMPNWLAPQIEILETFPAVGTVTGYPTRLESRWGVSETKKWAEWNNKYNAHIRPNHANPHLLFDVTIENGRFIPDEWERDYCATHNRNWETHQINTKNDVDTKITYRGVSALATGHHCQFVCYPERIEPLIPWTDRAMADERPIDEAIDAAGYLRLATVERLTRHIGNVLETE